MVHFFDACWIAKKATLSAESSRGSRFATCACRACSNNCASPTAQQRQDLL